jgi:ketopantoate reductase
MDEKDLKILFIGAGAIGGSAAAWVAGHHEQTYLFDLNGYLLSLADRVGTKAPYNRTIYNLCQEHFTRPDF